MKSRKREVIRFTDCAMTVDNLIQILEVLKQNGKIIGKQELMVRKDSLTEHLVILNLDNLNKSSEISWNQLGETVSFCSDFIDENIKGKLLLLAEKYDKD